MAHPIVLYNFITNKHPARRQERRHGLIRQGSIKTENRHTAGRATPVLPALSWKEAEMEKIIFSILATIAVIVTEVVKYHDENED